MKKIFLISIILSLLLTIGCNNNIEDQGMTSSTHKKYVKQIVFSNEEINFQNEDSSKFKNEFKWNEPIYYRAYFKQSIENKYLKENWDSENKTYYILEMKINGKTTAYDINYIKPHWTTFKGCVIRNENDNRGWDTTKLFKNSQKYLNPGNNTVEIIITAYNRMKKKKALKITSKGNFTIKAPKNLFTVKIDENTAIFKDVKASSISDSRKSLIFNFNIDGQNSHLKIRGGNKFQVDYEFNEKNYRIEQLETSSSNLPSKWRIKTGDGYIKIIQKDEEQKKWQIIGKNLLNVKAEFKYKEWIIKGNNGTLKLIASGHTNSNKWWDFWIIKDNMKLENKHLKMGAIYTVLISTLWNSNYSPIQ